MKNREILYIFASLSMATNQYNEHISYPGNILTPYRHNRLVASLMAFFIVLLYELYRKVIHEYQSKTTVKDPSVSEEPALLTLQQATTSAQGGVDTECERVT